MSYVFYCQHQLDHKIDHKPNEPYKENPVISVEKENPVNPEEIVEPKEIENQIEQLEEKRPENIITKSRC